MVPGAVGLCLLCLLQIVAVLRCCVDGVKKFVMLVGRCCGY